MHQERVSSDCNREVAVSRPANSKLNTVHRWSAAVNLPQAPPTGFYTPIYKYWLRRGEKDNESAGRLSVGAPGLHTHVHSTSPWCLMKERLLMSIVILSCKADKG